MDTRLSCFIWGIIGVIFGLLALLFPEIMLETFYIIFLILIGLCIVIFLFLAITSKSDESMFWFGLSAGLLVLAVISYLAKLIAENVFLLLIAVIAFYNGFTDIMLALKHPRTKYFLIPGMFITGVALLAALLRYIPDLSKHLILITLGSFALVFGLFSIVMGYYQGGEPEQAISGVQQDTTCQDLKHQGKK